MREAVHYAFNNINVMENNEMQTNLRKVALYNDRGVFRLFTRHNEEAFSIKQRNAVNYNFYNIQQSENDWGREENYRNYEQFLRLKCFDTMQCRDLTSSNFKNAFLITETQGALVEAGDFSEENGQLRIPKKEIHKGDWYDYDHSTQDLGCREIGVDEQKDEFNLETDLYKNIKTIYQKPFIMYNGKISYLVGDRETIFNTYNDYRNLFEDQIIQNYTIGAYGKVNYRYNDYLMLGSYLSAYLLFGYVGNPTYWTNPIPFNDYILLKVIKIDEQTLARDTYYLSGVIHTTSYLSRLEDLWGATLTCYKKNRTKITDEKKQLHLRVVKQSPTYEASYQPRF